MFELNPYQYGSADYYKEEVKLAKRNLNFVVSGAGQQIKDKDCDLKEEQEIIISACESVVLANEQYKNALKRYEEAKAKEDKHNADNQ